MTRIYIHSNGDAANHGCEAIIRTTYNMLKPIAGEIGYPTYNITNDKKYGKHEERKIQGNKQEE